MREENLGTLLTLSMDSFPPATILNIDNRGALFKKRQIHLFLNKKK